MVAAIKLADSMKKAKGKKKARRKAKAASRLTVALDPENPIRVYFEF